MNHGKRVIVVRVIEVLQRALFCDCVFLISSSLDASRSLCYLVSNLLFSTETCLFCRTS